MIRVKYFDGLSSKPLPMSLEISDDALYLKEVNLTFTCKEVHLSPKIEGTPQTLTFPNGAFCEIAPENTFLLPKSRSQTWVLTMESKFRYIALLFILLIGFSVFWLTYGSKWGAHVVANALPQETLNGISEQTLDMLDNVYLFKSRLPQNTQTYLQEEFDALVDTKDSFTLHFRTAPKIGPNAFALPSGDIILTDELVALDTDEELRGVIGVLAHEQGHVVHRHSLKSMIRTSIGAALSAYLLGDISSLAVTASTALLGANYSREHEVEADTYSLALLEKRGISSLHLAHLFEKIEKLQPAKSNGFLSFISTHPNTDLRIQRFHEAARQSQ